MMPMIPSHQTPGPVPVKASDDEDAEVADLVVVAVCRQPVVAEEAAVEDVVGGGAFLFVLNEIFTGTSSPARSPTAITQ